MNAVNEGWKTHVIVSLMIWRTDIFNEKGIIFAEFTLVSIYITF
jgi:hypothetical protein